MSRTPPDLGEQKADAAPGEPLAHVLICDDDPELRHLLATFLGEHDFKVTLAADGRELQHPLRANPAVDLVILDVMLPGTSGLELCRELRATSTVPIMMLTARGDETDRIVGLAMSQHRPSFRRRPILVRWAPWRAINRAIWRQRPPPEA